VALSAAKSDISMNSTEAQGLTLVRLSAQSKRFLWDKGCLGVAEGVFVVGMEGVFRRLGGVSSVRNSSG